MAVRAVAAIAETDVNSGDEGLFNVAAYITMFGDIGSFNQRKQVTWLEGLDPDSVTLAQDIRTALRTYMENNGVVFEITDTVVLV